MSSPEVLRDTMRLAEQEGLRVALAPAWYDVDTIDDLRRFLAELPLAAKETDSHTLRFLRTPVAIPSTREQSDRRH